jgi:hypothetical protein
MDWSTSPATSRTDDQAFVARLLAPLTPGALAALL